MPCHCTIVTIEEKRFTSDWSDWMNQFDLHVERKGTASVKWDLTKEVFGTDDLLPMWVADMDFKAPKEVMKSLQERVEHGVFGYSFPTPQTRKIVQQWIKQRHNWNVPLSSIEFSSGVVKALATTIEALTRKGDQIVIQPPVYYPFFSLVEQNERVIVENQLIYEEGQYKMDFDHLEAALKNPKTKMLLLCNPQNPGGRVWSREELKRVGDLCLEHHVYIVSDEIHSDLVLFDHIHTPLASIDERFMEISITCHAPSKTFNLAGLQASVMIIPNEEIRIKIKEVEKKQGVFTINSLGITALEAAYQFGLPWLNDLKTYLEKNVQLVEDFIESEISALSVIHPQSTYLVWIDYRMLQISEKDFEQKLINYGKLGLEMGSKYGKSGEGFVRMNIGTQQSVVRNGLERLKRAVQCS